MRKQRVIVVVGFAKTIAGIEHDVRALQAGGKSIVQSAAEAAADERHYFVVVEARLRAPFVRTPARVHQYDAAAQARAGGSHFRIPGKGAHVVHDLSAGEDRSFGGD